MDGSLKEHTLGLGQDAQGECEMRHDWEEAVEKYAHSWIQEKGGFLCPFTNEIVEQCYTDHTRGGYDEGQFRIVSINACVKCGDPNFSVMGRLKELNEQRKARGNVE